MKTRRQSNESLDARFVEIQDIVVASYYISVGASTNNGVPINYDIIEIDTHNAVLTGVGVWRFTAPSDGIYQVMGRATNAAGSADYAIYKNGNIRKTIMAAQVGVTAIGGGGFVELNEGEYIDIRPSATITPAGISGSNILSHINISKIRNLG